MNNNPKNIRPICVHFAILNFLLFNPLSEDNESDFLLRSHYSSNVTIKRNKTGYLCIYTHFFSKWLVIQKHDLFYELCNKNITCFTASRSLVQIIPCREEEKSHTSPSE